MGNLPLDGIRVLDIGQALAVPYTARLLAQMGAQVIMLESRLHLGVRGVPPHAYGKEGPNTSGLFNLPASNKRSCTLNLTTEKGQGLLKRLVQVSDVVLENFSHRIMQKFGLDYPSLSQIKPDIIVASLSAFGRTGPMKKYVGLHSAVSFFSGASNVLRYGPQDRPRILGSYFPDPFSGTAACLAVLYAIYHRRKTGRGQFIDLSMSEALTHTYPESISDFIQNGHNDRPIGNRNPYKAPCGVYRCRGGNNWVAVSVGTEDQWKALCEVLGNPTLAQDIRFTNVASRWQYHDELDAIITTWTRKHSNYETMHQLQAHGIPAAACLNSKELFNDPHLKARNAIVSTDHAEAGRRRMLGIPWKIQGIPKVQYKAAPCIGEHTDEILRELLEVSEEEIQDLRQSNALE